MRITLKKSELTPGVYLGYVEKITGSKAQNGTNFINLQFVLEDENEETFKLTKSFVRNFGKNQKLIEFVEELGILESDDTVELEEIKEFDFDVTVSSDQSGKLFISNLEPIWYGESEEPKEETREKKRREKKVQEEDVEIDFEED